MENKISEEKTKKQEVRVTNTSQSPFKKQED